MTLGELIDVLKNSAESASDTTDISATHTRQDSANRSNSLSETCGSQTAISSLGIAGNPVVNFHIVIEEKLPVHARKRYEKQVNSFFRFRFYRKLLMIIFRSLNIFKQPFKTSIHGCKWTSLQLKQQSPSSSRY